MVLSMWLARSLPLCYMGHGKTTTSGDGVFPSTPQCSMLCLACPPSVSPLPGPGSTSAVREETQETFRHCSILNSSSLQTLLEKYRPVVVLALWQHWKFAVAPKRASFKQTVGQFQRSTKKDWILSNSTLYFLSPFPKTSAARRRGSQLVLSAA